MHVKRTYYGSSSHRVSPFGNLRIKACSAAPRSLSQLRYVLHRHKKPRHPPYALDFPLGNLYTTLRFCFACSYPVVNFGIGLRLACLSARDAKIYYRNTICFLIQPSPSRSVRTWLRLGSRSNVSLNSVSKSVFHDLWRDDSNFTFEFFTKNFPFLKEKPLLSSGIEKTTNRFSFAAGNSWNYS